LQFRPQGQHSEIVSCAASSGYDSLDPEHVTIVLAVAWSVNINTSAIPLRAILITFCVATVPLLAVAAAGILWRVNVTDMTRDIAFVAELHPLTGGLSSLGVLLWWTSATVWLFSAFLRLSPGAGEDVSFMVYSGLLSAYLALDDLFQFHEYLAPSMLKVPESVVYVLLAVATSYYLWRFRTLLRRPDGVLLLASLAFLCCSLLVDEALELEPWQWRLSEWPYFVEDGFKWLGIAFWTTFSIRRCGSELRSMLTAAPDARGK
jgi:hypothetical protein